MTVQAIILMTVLAVVLSGCGPASGPSGAAGGGETGGATPKKGGTLRFIQNADVTDMDPHTSARGSSTVWRFVGNQFVAVDYEKSEMIPALAESWSVSPDGLTWDFKVRQGVKYHDKPPVNGRELTAQDIAAVYKRIMTPQPQFIYASQFKGATVEATDRYTVRFVLPKRDASFLANVAYHFHQMPAPETWQQFGDLKRPELSAIGTGPFLLSEWEPGVGAKFRRNPDYWRPGQPYLDGVQWSFIKDKNATVAALRTGKIDYLARVDRSDMEEVSKSNPQVSWSKAPDSPWNALRFDLFNPPFNDIRVRRAIDLAIDRDEIIRLVAQGDGEKGPPVSFWVSKWALPQEELKQRPEYGAWPMERRLTEAKSLLAQAGYGSGLSSFPCLVPTGSRLSVDIATVVKEQLKRNLSIDLALQSIDTGQVEKAHTEGKFTCTIYSYASGFDPSEYIHRFYHREGSRNYSRWDDPKLNAMAEAQAQELDESKRVQQVREAQRYIMDQHVLPQMLQYYEWRGSYSYVRGANESPIGDFYYYADQMWLDK